MSKDKQTGLRYRLKETLKPLDSIDKEITAQLSICANKSSICGNWRSSMKILEISCHGLTWLPSLLVIIWLSQNPYVEEIAVNLISAIVLDLIIVALSKAVIRRKRPSGNNDDMFFTVGPDHYSFPSGHASRATMLAIIFIRKNICGVFVVTLVTFWAIAVCLSRILLGRHHVGDVVVGILLGYVEAIFVLAVLWFGPKSTENILKIFTLFEVFHSSDSG